VKSHPNRFFQYFTAFLKVYWRNEIPLRAAGISFFVFFSMVPLLTTLVSFVVTLPSWRRGAQQALPYLTRWLLPGAIHEVQEYFHAFAEHAGVISIASIILSMWLLMKIVFFVEETLNKIWMLKPKRSPFRIMKKVFLAGLFLGSFVTMGILVSGTGLKGILVEILGTLSLFLGFNKVLPNRQIEWKQVIPGSVIGGTIWYVSKWGFTFYTQHLAKPKMHR
jgi:membrane protein